LFLETLEDRTLLSGGQWLVDITGLPGNTRDVQMAAAQQLFQQDGVDPNLQVVNHFGADGVLLVQAPTSYTQQMVYQAVSKVAANSATAAGNHMVIDVEEYDPDKDPSAYNVAFPPPIDPGEFQPLSGGGVAPNTGNPPGGPGGPGGGPLTVNPVNGFVGIKGGQSGGFIPPDSDGTVGPNSFIAIANNAVGIFDKVTGNPIAGGAVESTNTFFNAGLGGVLNLSDPVVIYNEITGQFFVEELDYNTSNASRLDVAISKGNNPTLSASDWNFFRYDVNDHTGANFDFADYPKVGYTADGYVVSFNMFPNVAFFDHVSTISIRNDGTSPGIHVVPGGFSNFTMAPASEHGSVSGDPMWFVQDGHGGGGGSTISVVREDDPFGAQTFNPGNFFTLSVNAYGNAVNTTQPNGGSIAMGGLGTRFYFSDMRTVSGVTHLVSSDTVGASGGDRARWYDLTISGGVPSVSQQGNIDPVVSSSSTYLPTIAIAPNGNLGVNFAESGLNEFLSMYVTGRAPGDAPNTMQTPVLAKAGDANLDNPQRIGDYSFQSIDPTDGTFWGVNEFASNSNGFPNWGEWVEHFNINASPPPPPQSPGAITGRVFNDPLHNGADVPNNPGLPGWLVYIDVKHTGVFDPNLDPFQITDASGNYEFDNLKPGTYFIGEVLLPTYVESTPVSLFGEQTVIVPSGTTVKKVDFGDYQTSAQVLIDDADPVNFTTNGGDWDPNNPNGFNGGSHTNPNLDPTQNAQWTVATGTGSFELFATWANDASYDPNATYKIFDGTTSGTLLGTVTENQVNAAYQGYINGGFWDKLGTFTTTTGTFTIELVADGDGKTIDADAVFAAKAPLVTKTLFYGGDFDPNHLGTSGLANERNTVVTQSSIYQNFVVPVGQTWTVTALFSNDLVVPTSWTSADWSIRTGVSQGNGGTVVASATGAAVTVTPTGRSGFGLAEDNFTVSGLSVTLGPGTYWMNVTPVDSGGGRSFNSNTFGKNQVGSDIPNDQFWDSSFFNVHFTNANNAGFFPDFSDGVIGTVSTTSVAIAVVHVGTDETGAFGAQNAITYLKSDSRFSSVTDINVDTSGVPTAGQLSQYGAVLAVTDNRDGTITGGGLGTQLGNVLDTYYHNGGRVILSAFDGNGQIGIDGNILNDSPATMGGAGNANAGSMNIPAGNPFPFGKVTSFSSTFASPIGLSAKGTDITNYASGTLGVVTNADNSIMFVNGFPFDQADYGNGTQFGLLFANALAGSNPAVTAPASHSIVGGTTSSSNAGGTGSSTAPPMVTGGATGTPKAPTGVVGNASTSSSVSPLDNLFISMGNAAPINPAPAQLPPSNGNTPTITGAAFNTYMTSLPSASNTDLVPGDGGDGQTSSEDPLL
jgi:hypothetical protein